MDDSARDFDTKVSDGKTVTVGEAWTGIAKIVREGSFEDIANLGVETAKELLQGQDVKLHPQNWDVPLLSTPQFGKGMWSKKLEDFEEQCGLAEELESYSARP